MDIIDCIPPKAEDRDTFNDIYILMPKYDMTLRRLIRSKQKLTDNHIFYLSLQLARGLEYMHKSHIIHRDLKPDNIMLKLSNCHLKIADFGMATLGQTISGTDIGNPHGMTGSIGNRCYLAPEVYCNDDWGSWTMDVWSFGCIIAELYTRKPLFNASHDIRSLMMIFELFGKPQDIKWMKYSAAKRWVEGYLASDIMKAGPTKDLRSILKGSTELACDFVRSILVFDPLQRPSMSKLLRHKFLTRMNVRKCHHGDIPDWVQLNAVLEQWTVYKTPFGVRHGMYEEMTKFHEKVLVYQNPLLVHSYIGRACRYFRLNIPTEICGCIAEFFSF